MTPETWQIIGIVVGAVVLLAVIAWAISRSRRSNDHAHNTDVRLTPAALSREIDSVKERHSLVDGRLERYDRSHQEMREELTRLHTELDSRNQQLSAFERMYKELQEQIYELREEHKVLLQREDRQERLVHELQSKIVTDDRPAVSRSSSSTRL